MKFILTPELGRLAKWLRILGFDAAYYTQINFAALLIQALRDSRVILTRNARFIAKARAVRLVCIKSEQVKQQLKQVLGELSIEPDRETMFTRCLICNEQLEQIDKQRIRQEIPAYVFKTQDEFLTCPSCRRIYWSGTHWGNVAQILEEIMGSK